MQYRRLITGVAAVLAGLSLVLVVLAAAYNPVFLLLAAVLGAAASLMWYQASGRLAGRVYRAVERQAARNDGGRRARGGFGAGPREERTPPGDRRRAGGGTRRRGRRARAGRRGPAEDAGLSRTEACRRLGLDTDADEATVKRAYRERVKEVHPDNGGDEEAFKRVTEAYERLT